MATGSPLGASDDSIRERHQRYTSLPTEEESYPVNPSPSRAQSPEYNYTRSPPLSPSPSPNVPEASFSLGATLRKTGNLQLVKIVALLCLMMTIATVVVLFLIPESPAQIYLLQAMDWLGKIPEEWGAILLSVFYAAALVICFPGTPFNLAAGFLFGVWIGSIVSVVGCDIGACLSFFLGKTLGREWAQEKIVSNPKYELINRAVEKNGFLIIFLIRLSPVFPFGICNYLFGITNITFWKYWASTTLGLIPCTVAYTYLGSLMRNLTDIYSGDGEQEQQTILVVVALVLTIMGIVVITLVTKRTLSKAMEERKQEDSLLANEAGVPGGPVTLQDISRTTPPQHVV